VFLAFRVHTEALLIAPFSLLQVTERANVHVCVTHTGHAGCLSSSITNALEQSQGFFSRLEADRLAALLLDSAQFVQANPQ
jgi:hypothetical protein